MADKMTVIVSETPEALADRVAADFAALVKETLSSRDRFTVALSGGVTPKGLYTRLASEPYRSSIPWNKLWIFWGDERCVPKDHPDSNYRMTEEALLRYVPVASDHVFRMHGEDPPPQAAREYEKILRRVFGVDEPWPAFDLILLGLGPNGHTASLFPGTPALADGERWVVGNVVRAQQTVRITLTLPVLNHARQAWFLVTGAKKVEIFAKAQASPDPECPASLVKPDSGELRWYVDQAVVQSGDRGQGSVIRK